MPYRCARAEVAARAQHAHRGRHDDPDEGARDEDLPAEPHELVVAQPGQRAAQPDEDEEEHPELQHEPQHRPPAGVEHPVPDRRQRPRRTPPAEEQRGGDRRDGDHVHVLGEEEQRELQRGVLGVEAADELALGLGQVERRTVGLAHHRDAVDDEGRQHDDRVPRGHLPVPADDGSVTVAPCACASTIAEVDIEPA